MPLKSYAIDAIHLFLSGGRFFLEVVIEKRKRKKEVLCVHWLDLHRNIKGKKMY